jgi:hypothetical protein
VSTDTPDAPLRTGSAAAVALAARAVAARKRRASSSLHPGDAAPPIHLGGMLLRSRATWAACMRAFARFAAEEVKREASAGARRVLDAAFRSREPAVGDVPGRPARRGHEQNVSSTKRWRIGRPGLATRRRRWTGRVAEALRTLLQRPRRCWARERARARVAGPPPTPRRPPGRATMPVDQRLPTWLPRTLTAAAHRRGRAPARPRGEPGRKLLPERAERRFVMVRSPMSPSAPLGMSHLPLTRSNSRSPKERCAAHDEDHREWPQQQRRGDHLRQRLTKLVHPIRSASGPGAADRVRIDRLAVLSRRWAAGRTTICTRRTTTIAPARTRPASGFAGGNAAGGPP